eukprot:g43908.t1
MGRVGQIDGKEDGQVVSGQRGVDDRVGWTWDEAGAYRAHMLCESVTESESVLGLTHVEEATSGATGTIDQVGGCTGEPLSDLEGLPGALDGGERGGVGADVAPLAVAGKGAGYGG